MPSLFGASKLRFWQLSVESGASYGHVQERVSNPSQPPDQPLSDVLCLGRWNGAEKAITHEQLCRFYVAVAFGIEPGMARRDHNEVYEAVHRDTQELTDNLDEKIGFPLESQPDYNALVPRFFEEFHSLAVKRLQRFVEFDILQSDN